MTVIRLFFFCAQKLGKKFQSIRFKSLFSFSKKEVLLKDYRQLGYRECVSENIFHSLENFLKWKMSTSLLTLGRPVMVTKIRIISTWKIDLKKHAARDLNTTHLKRENVFLFSLLRKNE